MRQPTTAEVRLDEHKTARFGPSGAEHLAVLAVNELAAIEFRCRGTPRDGRSRSNGPGIRRMSVYSLRSARRNWR
jgi:hypothetical protein